MLLQEALKSWRKSWSLTKAKAMSWSRSGIIPGSRAEPGNDWVGKKFAGMVPSVQVDNKLSMSWWSPTRHSSWQEFSSMSRRVILPSPVASARQDLGHWEMFISLLFKKTDVLNQVQCKAAGWVAAGTPEVVKSASTERFQMGLGEVLTACSNGPASHWGWTTQFSKDPSSLHGPVILIHQLYD